MTSVQELAALAATSTGRPVPGIDSERLRLREVVTAAGCARDEWDTSDRGMAEQHPNRGAVRPGPRPQQLITPSLAS